MVATAEELARKENRSMSELVREALRRYQRTQERWEELYAYGEANAKRLGIRREEDVTRLIKEWRKSRRGTTPEPTPKRTGTR